MASDEMFKELAKQLVDKAKRDWLGLTVKLMRQHAHKFRGRDGEVTMLEYAKIIEEVGAGDGE